MTGKITAPFCSGARRFPRRPFAALFAFPLLLAAACGQPGPPPTAKTISCTLRWTGSADLDLTIDSVSAARLGGSPDVTQGGGSESFNIDETDARDTVVVGAANRSAEPGGLGDTSAKATITLVRHDGSSVTIDHAMDTAPWPAAIVHPRTGLIVPFP